MGFAIALLVWRDSAWQMLSVPPGKTRKLICGTAFAAGWVCVALGAHASHAQESEQLIPLKFNQSAAFNTLAGLLFVASAFGDWKHPLLSWIGGWRRYTYGIFLAHTLFIEAGQAVFHRMKIGPSPACDVITFVFAIGGSILLTMATRQSRFTKWLLPG